MSRGGRAARPAAAVRRDPRSCPRAHRRPPYASASHAYTQVPAVRKGLNNQRMRIVQDAVVATLLGAAVELPRYVRTRARCGYRIPPRREITFSVRQGCRAGTSCYKNYSVLVPFGDVYDEAATVTALRAAGVCVTRTHLPDDARVPELAGIAWPVPASQLPTIVPRRPSAVDAVGDALRGNSSTPQFKRPRQTARLEARARVRALVRTMTEASDACDRVTVAASRHVISDGVYSLGGEGECCVRLVANTRRSAKLLTRVNAAFAPSRRIAAAVARTEARFRERTAAPLVAIHWRADEDFVQSAHGLSADAAARAACDAIRPFASGHAVVLFLGDLDFDRMRTVAKSIDGACGGALRRHVAFTTKGKLLEADGGLDPWLDTRDDVRGQVDYELGVRADHFIGSPFSSFSVLIALQRPSVKTTMLAVDVQDRLGRIFALVFPYGDGAKTHKARQTLCADIVNAHKAYNDSLAACVRRETSGSAKPHIQFHVFKSCYQCMPTLKDVCRFPDTPKHQKVTWKLFVRSATRNHRDLRAALAQVEVTPELGPLRMSCDEALKSFQAHGAHFDPAMRSVYLIKKTRPKVEAACKAEEECYASRYPDLSRKYCQAGRCDYVALRNHHKTHGRGEGRVYGCFAAPTAVCGTPCGIVSLGTVLRAAFRQPPAVSGDAVCPDSFKIPAIDLGLAGPIDAPEATGGRICALAVATVLYGTADRLEPARVLRDRHRHLAAFEAEIGLASCWYVFVDGTAAANLRCDMSHGPYRVVRLPKTAQPYADDRRGLNSRVPKMLAHLAFTQARWFLYIDAKLRLPDPALVWTLLHDRLVAPGAVWTSPRHPMRTSAVEEARCVHMLGLADDRVLHQARAYLQEGFDHGDGRLAEGEWHLRDLADPRSSQIGCAWFAEFWKWGHGRDQVAFPITLARLGVTSVQLASYQECDRMFRHVEHMVTPNTSKRRSSAECVLPPGEGVDYIHKYIHSMGVDGGRVKPRRPLKPPKQKAQHLRWKNPKSPKRTRTRRIVVRRGRKPNKQKQ